MTRGFLGQSNMPVLSGPQGTPLSSLPKVWVAAFVHHLSQRGPPSHTHFRQTEGPCLRHVEADEDQVFLLMPQSLIAGLALHSLSLQPSAQTIRLCWMRELCLKPWRSISRCTCLRHPSRGRLMPPREPQSRCQFPSMTPLCPLPSRPWPTRWLNVFRQHRGHKGLYTHTNRIGWTTMSDTFFMMPPCLPHGSVFFHMCHFGTQLQPVPHLSVSLFTRTVRQLVHLGTLRRQHGLLRYGFNAMTLRAFLSMWEVARIPLRRLTRNTIWGKVTSRPLQVSCLHWPGLRCGRWKWGPLTPHR